MLKSPNIRFPYPVYRRTGRSGTCVNVEETTWVWAVCVGMLCVNVDVEITLNGLFMQCSEGGKIMCCWFRFLVFIGFPFRVSRCWPTVQAWVISTCGSPVLNFGQKAGCENLIYLISEFYVTTLVVAVRLLNYRGYLEQWLSRNLRNSSRCFAAEMGGRRKAKLL
jgi:hypothetical protein